MMKLPRRWLAAKRWGIAGLVMAAPLVMAAAPASPAAPGVPTPAKMARVMAHFHEIHAASEFLAPSGKLVTTTSSDGSTLSAVAGTRSPSADGYGQLVFFFHGDQYVGVSSVWEAMAIIKIAADGVNRFKVTYANYAPSDAAFDPTLKPVTVVYTWNGAKFVSSRTLPSGVGDKIEVHWLAEPTAPATTKVAAVMGHVHEIQNPSEHFVPTGNLVLSSGPEGAMYSAIVGTRFPTADGYGQLVFFFAGNRYVGVNSTAEATAITQVYAYSDGRFAVTYANYTPKDPTDDPTLKPVTIVYTWTGTGFRASKPLPSGVLNQLSTHWVSGS